MKLVGAAVMSSGNSRERSTKQEIRLTASPDAELHAPMMDPQVTEESDTHVSFSSVDSWRTSAEADAPATGLTESEFVCHCCYDVLVNPTTLNCGHSFCRHCLALWWESSGKTECPECRERWEGFPKVNILLRDTVEKLFQDNMRRRRKEIQCNPRIAHSLLAFQRHGDEQASRTAAPRDPRRTGSFFSGVLTALTCVAVVLLVLHWSSGETQREVLVRKPLSRWTVDDVTLWLEHLGAWTIQYRETFHREQVNGRLLTLLEDEELSNAPYSMNNPTHRRAILEELQQVQTTGVKMPQNLWEYKALNGGKSLFLLYALKDSPRLTILYLYLFDYDDSFLPLIHTCCPTQRPQLDQDYNLIFTKSPKEEPKWRQWAEFVMKYCVLPYQLLAEFAWDWLSVHYWTSRFVIVNTMLLSVLEACTFWRVWSRGEIRTLPQMMWRHLWRVLTHGVVITLLWPITPRFMCNCLFYWGLYFNPVINIDMVVQQILHRNTQHA